MHRPLDLGLAGEEEHPRHDEPQAERHQRVGDEPRQIDDDNDANVGRRAAISVMEPRSHHRGENARSIARPRTPACLRPHRTAVF